MEDRLHGASSLRPPHPRSGRCGRRRPKRTQRAMVSGSCRALGGPAAARHSGQRRSPVAGGGREPTPAQLPDPGAVARRRAPRRVTSVKNPEAYTGSRLEPAMTTWSTCHVRRACRTAASCGRRPRGQRRSRRWSGRSGSGGPTPGRRCRPGRPSALGVLSAAPASRKCMPSTACHSMGCVEPETAKGMVSTTLSVGKRRRRRAQVRRGVHPHHPERHVEGDEDGHHARRPHDRRGGDGGDHASGVPRATRSAAGAVRGGRRGRRRAGRPGTA